MKFFYFVFASLVVGCASTPNALRSGAEVRSDPRPHAHAARSSVRSAARSVGEQAASKLERGNRIQTDARRRITREIQKEIKSLENHRTRQKISSAHTVANLEKATIERGANAPALAASTPVSTEAALRASPLLSDSGMTATDSTLAPSPADSRLVGELAPMQRPPSKTKRVPVLVNPEFQSGEIATSPEAEVTVLPAGPLKHLKTFEARDVQLSPKNNTPLIFELPVTYNDRVKSWINYFQTDGRLSFRRWLERSTRYLPYIQSELEAARMPQDLIYVAMIESGFSPGAVSPAHAVGMWQFIRATGNRYGLRTTWWLDERRDVYKSTKAAIAYMQDLYKMFGSWYLVAASYNMGEGGVKRLIKKY
ncbi:MAG: transglycosylase SLT domain-containing protein, partial [Bdellovibrionaceae bacterium]|nr:transglycosylase SLT domain-containing protein [Pseudobdellovibrionaceae bacterium]